MSTIMKRDIKTEQIVVRFDKRSYDKICEYAEVEHRGLGEFVRHAALYYIEQFSNDHISLRIASDH